MCSESCSIKMSVFTPLESGDYLQLSQQDVLSQYIMGCYYTKPAKNQPLWPRMYKKRAAEATQNRKSI